jgi:hypothetical protein
MNMLYEYLNNRRARKAAARQNENDLAKMDDRSGDATNETDAYVRDWAARQSESDLAKMDDRSGEATYNTDEYVRRMLADRQNENDLAKMDDRSEEATKETDEYVRRRMSTRRRTMAVAGGAAALGSAALIYFLMRKYGRKNKPAAPRKTLA